MSTQRISPIVLENGMSDFEFDCTSELYGKTIAASSIGMAVDRRFAPCGDGSTYFFKDFEVDALKAYLKSNKDNLEIPVNVYCELKKSIDKLIPDGNDLLLPKEQLKNYKEVKSTLINCLGKYNRNKFTFPVKGISIKKMILEGDVDNFKKKFQFFHTPKHVCDKMLNQIIGYPKTILEPSAGQGHLIDAVLEYRPDSYITALELSDLNYQVLKEKYQDEDRVDVIKCDFNEYDIDNEFDLIIANPPFSYNQDVQHISKMFFHKKNPDSQIITLSSESWTFKNDKASKHFRQFVENECRYVEPIEQNAFKEAGTAVKTNMIVF